LNNRLKKNGDCVFSGTIFEYYTLEILKENYFQF